MYIGSAIIAFDCELIDSSLHLGLGNRSKRRCLHRCDLGNTYHQSFPTLRLGITVSILALALGIWTLAKAIL